VKCTVALQSRDIQRKDIENILFVMSFNRVNLNKFISINSSGLFMCFRATLNWVQRAQDWPSLCSRTHLSAAGDAKTSAFALPLTPGPDP